jgi:polysaccharide biosynthesis protein PslH
MPSCACARTAKLAIIPNGIALPDPPVPQSQPSTPCRLLFVGALGYAPNMQGILWFMREVWPHLTPAAFHLNIIGRKPPPEVQALASLPHVELAADVPDVAPYYAQCDLALAPILYGGGTRIKILEALAHKRGVVATPIGAEGLPAGSANGIVVAQEPAQMAQSLEQLRQNPQTILELGAAGFNMVHQHYAMAHIERQLHALITA